MGGYGRMNEGHVLQSHISRRVTARFSLTSASYPLRPTPYCPTPHLNPYGRHNWGMSMDL
jgi:hypothetical protein